MSLCVLPFATTHSGGEGSSSSVPIVAVISGSVSSEDRRYSLSAWIWSIWSWDMLFGWDVEEEEGFCVQIGFSIGLLLGVEEEEFCFQIGFSIGVYSWGFVSCVILIPVNTQVIDRDLPGLSIDCWLFGSFFRRIFTGKIFHLLPIGFCLSH